MTTPQLVTLLALFLFLFAGLVAVLTPEQVEPFVPETSVPVPADELGWLNGTV